MILAIDLGGTSAKIGLFDKEVLKQTWEIPTKVGDVWNNIKTNLTDINWDQVEAVGLSIPGFIDHKKNIVKLAGNLQWKNYDVQSDFKKYFKKDVYVLNDANAAALGEYWQGAGKGYSSMIMYTLGTGVGGGIIINGELVYGKDGFAGELGHGGNFQSKYPCTCGLNNCMEPASSATGIMKALAAGGFQLTLKEAGAQLESSAPIRKIFKEALTPLASHIAIMQCALNPDVVVIGGGVSNIGKPLLQLINEIVAEQQLDFIADSSPIILASTRNNAGMLGAAYWALKNHSQK